jgi:hypothetical protein
VIDGYDFEYWIDDGLLQNSCARQPSQLEVEVEEKETETGQEASKQGKARRIVFLR